MAVLAVLPKPHSHQTRVVGRLKSLYLQMVFRMAESEIAMLVRESRVVSELSKHPAVQFRLAPRHASLQLRTPSYSAICKQTELHDYTAARRNTGVWNSSLTT